MTTRTKEQDFKYLIKSGYSFPGVSAFFMREAGVNFADIARKTGVSRQSVRYIVNHGQGSALVKKAITEKLGFDPWQVINGG